LLYSEIKLRAERKAGEILKEQDMATGGQPYQSTYNKIVSVEPTLKNIGITLNQSSKWQRTADIPEMLKRSL